MITAVPAHVHMHLTSDSKLAHLMSAGSRSDSMHMANVMARPAAVLLALALVA